MFVRIHLISVLSCLLLTGCASDSRRQPEFDMGLLPNLPVKTAGAAGGFVDGRIVVVGGSDWNANKTIKIWRDDVYCFESGAWKELDPLDSPLAYCAYASDGKALYLAGGGDGKRSFRSAMRITEGGRVRTPLPDLPKAVALCSGTLCGGKFYLFGGMDKSGKAMNELYGLDLNHLRQGWKKLADLPAGGRFFAGFAAFGNQLYVLGGYGRKEDGTKGVLNDCYRYETTQNKWIRLRDLPEAIAGGNAFALSSGRILILGGSDGEIHNRLNLLDLEDMSFRQVGSLPFKTYTSTFIAGNARNLIVLGGEPDADRNRLDAVVALEIR